MGETATERYGCGVPQLEAERAFTAAAEVNPEVVKHRPDNAGLSYWRELCILLPMVFFLPRAVLPGGIAPAGLAMVAALSLVQVERMIWYVPAALIGLFSVGTPLAAAALLPSYLAAILLARRAGDIGKWTIVAIAGLQFAGRAAAVLLGWQSFSWPLTVVEAVLTAGLTLVFIRVAGVLRLGSAIPDRRNERFYLLIVPICLTVFGMSGISWYWLSLPFITGIFAVAFLSFMGGPGLGAGLGLSLALLPGWPAGYGLAWGGLMAGICRSGGRWAALLGLPMGLAVSLAVQDIGSSGILWRLAGQALIGLSLFLVLPAKVLGGLTTVVPDTSSWTTARQREQARLREVLTDRVQDLAGVFTQLSKAFTVHDQEGYEGTDLYSLLDKVVKRNCQECTGYEVCWRQNFYASYRELFDLIALAEMHGSAKPEHVRGRLASVCFQQRRLLETVNDLLAQVSTRQTARNKAEEDREFLAEQLEGVAEIMAGLAGEMRVDVDFRLEVEERLKNSFNRLGLAVKSLSVLDYGQDMLEVRIKKHACLNHFECQYLIAPMVSKLLGHSFMVWEKHCPQDCRGDCTFSLVPAGRYQIRHAVGRVAKEGGSSGDNHILQRTKDGRFAVILSDGMGTGPKAAQESQATVNLMAQLLSTGLREEFSLNLINSVLMMRTPEERFATIDMALIDLFRGQGEFIKVGAAPSYLKRGREISAIRATTPPAGILDRIEIDRQYRPLAIGDYLIMVSDGVYAGSLGQDEAEDWVERALARVEVAGPQSMVDFLLKIAQTSMGGEIKDDVTVIVLQMVSAGAL